MTVIKAFALTVLDFGLMGRSDNTIGLWLVLILEDLTDYLVMGYQSTNLHPATSITKYWSKFSITKTVFNPLLPRVITCQLKLF